MGQFDTGTLVQTADEINTNLAKLEKDNNINILDTELETSSNMLPEKPENTDD
jgi:hypothetical protein